MEVNMLLCLIYCSTYFTTNAKKNICSSEILRICSTVKAFFMYKSAFIFSSSKTTTLRFVSHLAVFYDSVIVIEPTQIVY